MSFFRIPQTAYWWLGFFFFLINITNTYNDYRLTIIVSISSRYFRQYYFIHIFWVPRTEKRHYNIVLYSFAFHTIMLSDIYFLSLRRWCKINTFLYIPECFKKIKNNYKTCTLPPSLRLYIIKKRNNSRWKHKKQKKPSYSILNTAVII